MVKKSKGKDFLGKTPNDSPKVKMKRSPLNLPSLALEIFHCLVQVGRKRTKKSVTSVSTHKLTFKLTPVTPSSLHAGNVSVKLHLVPRLVLPVMNRNNQFFCFQRFEDPQNPWKPPERVLAVTSYWPALSLVGVVDVSRVLDTGRLHFVVPGQSQSVLFSYGKVLLILLY